MTESRINHIYTIMGSQNIYNEPLMCCQCAAEYIFAFMFPVLSVSSGRMSHALERISLKKREKSKLSRIKDSSPYIYPSLAVFVRGKSSVEVLLSRCCFNVLIQNLWLGCVHGVLPMYRMVGFEELKMLMLCNNTCILRISPTVVHLPKCPHNNNGDTDHLPHQQRCYRRLFNLILDSLIFLPVAAIIRQAFSTLYQYSASIPSFIFAPLSRVFSRQSLLRQSSPNGRHNRRGHEPYSHDACTR